MSNAMMGMNLGEARRRQEAAKKRGERFKVSDDVRAARAALLQAKEEAATAAQAARDTERQARPDAVRAVLQHASIDELFEFQRAAGQLDGRRLAGIVADVLQERRRTTYVAPAAMVETAPELAAESPPVAKASSGRPGR
ncbi:hypothetical protein [Methylobacterium sp. D54C]